MIDAVANLFSSQPTYDVGVLYEVSYRGYTIAYLNQHPGGVPVDALPINPAVLVALKKSSKVYALTPKPVLPSMDNDYCKSLHAQWDRLRIELGLTTNSLTLEEKYEEVMRALLNKLKGFQRLDVPLGEIVPVDALVPTSIFDNKTSVDLIDAARDECLKAYADFSIGKMNTSEDQILVSKKVFSLITKDTLPFINLSLIFDMRAAIDHIRRQGYTVSQIT